MTLGGKRFIGGGHSSDYLDLEGKIRRGGDLWVNIWRFLLS